MLTVDVNYRRPVTSDDTVCLIVSSMLLRIIPLNALAKAFTRYDGDKLDGDTSAGWDIVDSFHSPLADPSHSTSVHIDTGYGGGGGTGFPNYFSGGAQFDFHDPGFV